MKINKYNTRDACNIPKPLSLKDPFNGETLIDEDGKTVDIFIYGRDSDVAKNALRDRERRYGKQATLTPEQGEQAGAEFLAAITQGWSPNLEDESGPIEFTKEAAIKLYKDNDWIANQVWRFHRNLANYDPLR
jgi:hypothetical protein